MHRKHAAKKSSEGGAKQKHRWREPSAPASQTSWAAWRQIAVALALLAALAAAVFLVLPTKYTGPSHHDTEEKRSEEETDVAASDEDDHVKSLSCGELMDRAKFVMDSHPKEEWEVALGYMATCALKEPKSVAPRWALAVALFEMGREAEAVGMVDEALTLDPTDREIWKKCGVLFTRLGYHDNAVTCLEWYLEYSLGVPSWEQLLATISVQREDEWMFLYEAGEDVIQVFELLLTSYLNSRSLIKAGYLYKVIIGLQGSRAHPDLLSAYSFFSFGLGDVTTGTKFLRMVTEHQYVSQGYGDEDQAYEVVLAHSLRLLTAGLEAHIVGIARNLLMSGDVVWEELEYNCDLGEEEEGRRNSSLSVSLSALKEIMVKCLVSQGVISALINEGAVVYAENIFGWTPVLHVAMLDSPALIHQLVSRNADPQSRTALAHTALHIAAMRGSYNIVLPLIQAGLKPSDMDYFKRTALQVACLNRWTASGMADALNVQLPHGCPAQVLYAPPLRQSLQGGWLSSGFQLPPELTREECGIDALVTSDVHIFLHEYLTLQRPVLIRNATSSHQMKSFFHLWQRNKFEQEFGSIVVSETEAPTFGQGRKAKAQTNLSAFLAKMREINREQKNVETVDHLPKPPHIFEALPFQSPLLGGFKLPHVLNPTVTHISMDQIKLHLGPALSGTPVQFHRSEWNVLIYGQRRWFLYPPDRAFYSRQHVWDWWREQYREDVSALECVQYPGDMVFVPDMWGHAAISLRESVGMSAEFVYGASEFSL